MSFPDVGGTSGFRPNFFSQRRKTKRRKHGPKKSHEWRTGGDSELKTHAKVNRAMEPAVLKMIDERSGVETDRDG